MGTVTSREGDVRMPRSQIGKQPDSERGFLDAFVQLKEVWMACANTDPNNLDHAFGRKCSNSFDRQKERTKFNRLEFFAQSKIDIVGDVGKKSESQVHLIASGPADATNARIEIDQNFLD